MKPLLAAIVVLALTGCATAERPPAASGWHLVRGSFVDGRGPDGNSVFLDAPAGLILVDTGRHPDHRDRLLGHARERGRPIAAIVNTHWHLDHTTGNGEIRAAHPGAEIYATTGIEGAITGFFPQSRAGAERFLASGRASAAQRAEIERGFAAMDNPASLRPTRPVRASGAVTIAGRRLRLEVAPFAASEGDIWIHVPEERLVIAGDLVVAPVPFMDTACPEGWRRALDAIAATGFTTLVPGHGAPMTRAEFLTWRTAFNNLLDCAASEATREACIAGWRRDAAPFQRPGREQLIDQMTGYYLDTRLRAAPEERELHCAPSPS
jgi:glyoxylase-like metal-dependent hydrolase (beta-lactamase superfamily II)